MKTDKGGKAALWKEGSRFFLVTIEKVATYKEIAEGERLKSVCIPLKKPARGGWTLFYVNAAEADIPAWKAYPYREGTSSVSVAEDTRLDFTKHDCLYYVEITGRNWASSVDYAPLTQSTHDISVGQVVQFGRQRLMGTGFLAENPQYRNSMDIEGDTTTYPGHALANFKVPSVATIPEYGTLDCKGASISYCLPGPFLKSAARPPMFLVDVNLKNSSCGWPVLNSSGALIGLVDECIYTNAAKDKCQPGVWCVAVSNDFSLLNAENAGSSSGEASASSSSSSPSPLPSAESGAEGNSSSAGGSDSASGASPASASEGAKKKKKKKKKKK